MWEDPIVAEVHKIRQELLARFDGDVDAYFQYIRGIEAEKRRRGVRYVEAPLHDPNLGGFKPCTSADL